MAQIRHEESAKIINQAIAALGQGNKGLADRLNKDPSLVSRYASGAVRPKAETLLKCMDFIQEESGLVSVGMRTVTTIDRFGLVTWRKGEPYLRMLQPTELKKAMGAGSNHLLPHGNRRDKVKLCGNGVCSSVMELIFKKITQIQLAELDIAS